MVNRTLKVAVGTGLLAVLAGCADQNNKTTYGPQFFGFGSKILGANSPDPRVAASSSVLGDALYLDANMKNQREAAREGRSETNVIVTSPNSSTQWRPGDSIYRDQPYDLDGKHFRGREYDFCTFSDANIGLQKVRGIKNVFAVNEPMEVLGTFSHRIENLDLYLKSLKDNSEVRLQKLDLNNTSRDVGVVGYPEGFVRTYVGYKFSGAGEYEFVWKSGLTGNVFGTSKFKVVDK